MLVMKKRTMLYVDVEFEFFTHSSHIDPLYT